MKISFNSRIALLTVALLLPISVLPLSQAIAAEVAFEDSKQEIIVFRGRIDRPSVSKLTDLLSRWQSLQRSNTMRPTVKIESPGGDVDAALSAGRALRQAKATVIVFGSPNQAMCSSSCIFFVAGAVERYVIGGLAIHNFFVASEDLTYEQVNATRRRLEGSIRSFFTEMNVSPLLYDRMLAVPPQSLRLLTEQEREELGLGMTDPTFRDYRLGEEASRRGIDKQTYIARLGSLVTVCGQPPSPPPLPEISSLNSSEWAAYQERQARYSSQSERLEVRWKKCKEGVLNGHIVR